MGEGNLGTQQQRAEAEVGEREDDVEVAVHVAVMEEMVAVEAEINSGAFDVALFREVHAPVDVFVGAVIGGTGNQRADDDAPVTAHEAPDEEWNLGEENEDGAVPPGHGNGVLVFFVDEMVGLVGLENLMVNDGVRFEGVIKFADRAMHDETVQRPFKERGVNDGANKTNSAPKQ